MADPAIDHKKDPNINYLAEDYTLDGLTSDLALMLWLGNCRNGGAPKALAGLEREVAPDHEAGYICAKIIERSVDAEILYEGYKEFLPANKREEFPESAIHGAVHSHAGADLTEIPIPGTDEKITIKSGLAYHAGYVQMELNSILNPETPIEPDTQFYIDNPANQRAIRDMCNSAKIPSRRLDDGSLRPEISQCVASGEAQWFLDHPDVAEEQEGTLLNAPKSPAVGTKSEAARGAVVPN